MYMTSAGREWLKWIALILMTGDHVNKVLLDGAYPWLTDAARVVFPIFAIVFVYNLRFHEDGDHSLRAATRLAIAGVVVQPFHALSFGYWLPLNVLLSLSAGAFVCWLFSRGRWLPALLLWVFAGLWVDYSWWGIAVMAASMAVFRPGHERSILLLPLAVASLAFINGNFWALASLPLIGLFARVPGNFPRWRWTFLGYYGGHLALLAILANY